MTTLHRSFAFVLFLLLLQTLAAQSIDYGDALSPYPTCSHTRLTTGQPQDLTILGPEVSYDSTNPVPGGWNADAGDDGVVITNFRKGGTATIDVYTWFSFGNTVYAVWCDFNDDGAWDATERVLIRGAGAGGYGLQVGKNTDTFAVPATATGTNCKIRARVWDAVYTGGATFGLGGPGAPSGACQGGECEDYDLAYEGNPEIDIITSPSSVPVPNGGSDFHGLLTLSTAATFTYQIYNRSTTTSLTLSAISITNVVGGSATIPGGFSTPVNVSPGAKYVLNVSVTPSAKRVTFKVNVTNNDTTGGESPYVVNATGGVGLSGNYTISNAGGTPDFTDIGAAFDELELVGANGNCTFTVTEGSTPYTSNASYGLGLHNNAAATEIAPVATNSSLPSPPTITFRAAAGQRPKITGSGAKFYYFWNLLEASVVIATSNVTFEGFEVMNGTQFGIVLLAKAQPVINCSNIKVSKCMIHDMSQGPAIMTFGVNWGTNQTVNQTIENNMIWGCTVGRAPVIYGFSTGSANIINGAISYWWASYTGTICRHNTVLVTNGQSSTGSAGCISFSRCYIAEHVGNVYVQLTSGQPVIYIHDAGSEPAISNYNGYYQGTGATFIGGTSSITTYCTSFAQWQGQGRDTNGFDTDPMLISMSGTPNLHIQGSSPAVDRVTSSSTASSDFDGDSRPLGAARDSGADEITPVTPDIDVREGSAAGPVLSSGQAAGGGRDFGTRDINSGASAALNIVIRNTGTATLTLGTPTLGGANPGEFVLDTTGFSAGVAPGNATSFSVAFDPATVGAKACTVSFTHNVSGPASPFVVNFAGNAVQNVAVVEVRETSVSGPVIANGAAAAGGRNFGNVDLAAMPTAALVIVVRNTGTGALTLGTPVMAGPDVASFVLDVSGMTANVAPGNGTSFSIAFNSSTLGSKNATVSFTHNDATTSTPFVFGVSGTAVTNNLPVITSTSPLTSGRDGVAYPAYNFTASGGFTPYVWSVSAGNLPPGLSLSSTGTLSGTPTSAGAYTFDIRVTDNVGSMDTVPFSITIDPSLTVGGAGGTGGGGGGCSTGETGSALWLCCLLLALAAARVARRVKA